MGMTVITLVVITSAVCSGTFFPQCAPTRAPSSLPPPPSAPFTSIYRDCSCLPLALSPAISWPFPPGRHARHPVALRLRRIPAIQVPGLDCSFSQATSRHLVSHNRPAACCTAGATRPCLNFTGLLTVHNTGVNLLNFEPSTKVDRLHSSTSAYQCTVSCLADCNR